MTEIKIIELITTGHDEPPGVPSWFTLKSSPPLEGLQHRTRNGGKKKRTKSKKRK